MNTFTANDEFETPTERLKASILKLADINTPVDIYADFDAEDVPAYFDFEEVETSHAGGGPDGSEKRAGLIGINLSGRPFTREECEEWFGTTAVTDWEKAASDAENGV